MKRFFYRTTQTLYYILSDFAKVVVTLFSTSHTTPAVVRVAQAVAANGIAGSNKLHARSTATHAPVTAHARFQLFLNQTTLATLSCTPSHTLAIGATAELSADGLWRWIFI